MCQLRKAVPIILCVLALWHAYVLLSRSLISHDFKFPAATAVAAYSRTLLLYPSWSFFYRVSKVNLKVHYRANDEMWKLFSGVGDTYTEKQRAYRCAACGNATFQLYLRDTPPPGHHWLVGQFICDLQPLSSVLSVRLSAAPYNSDQYQPVKEIEIQCADYK